MRVIGVLVLATGVVAGLAYLLVPGLAVVVPLADRPLATIAAAMIVGAGLAAIVMWAITEYRFLRLTKAVERMVHGDLTVSVSTAGSGLPRRLAQAINGISIALAETHDRATIDRLTGVVNRQALLG